MSNNAQATDNQGATAAKGTVIITLYRVDYTLDVNTDLSENIRKIIIKANQGRSTKTKHYKSPAVETIRERLLKAWSLRHTGRPVKTEFSSEATKGAICPFALVSFG
jgi:DNA-binding protein